MASIRSVWPPVFELRIFRCHSSGLLANVGRSHLDRRLRGHDLARRPGHQPAHAHKPFEEFANAVESPVDRQPRIRRIPAHDVQVVTIGLDHEPFGLQLLEIHQATGRLTGPHENPAESCRQFGRLVFGQDRQPGAAGPLHVVPQVLGRRGLLPRRNHNHRLGLSVFNQRGSAGRRGSRQRDHNPHTDDSTFFIIVPFLKVLRSDVRHCLAGVAR